MRWDAECPKCEIPQPRLEEGERLRDLTDGDILDFGKMTYFHRSVHRYRLRARQATGQLPLRYREREKLKSEGWNLICSSAPTEERLRGAVLVFHGWHQRSLEQAVHSGNLKHPPLEAYIGALPIEQIVPPELVGPVRSRYPKNASIYLEPSQWIWVP